MRCINNVVSISEYTFELTVLRGRLPLTSECRGTDTETWPICSKLEGSLIAYAPRPTFCISCSFDDEKREVKGSDLRKCLNLVDIRTSLFCFVRVFGEVVKWSV